MLISESRGQVFGQRRPLPDGLPVALIGLVAHTWISLPCTSRANTRLSAELAAVASTEWISLVFASTLASAFMPKYHCLPFFTWCISGSRAPLLFLVDEGAWRMVASTIGEPL